MHLAIDAEFAIVDIGIDAEMNDEGLTSKKVRFGTANFYKEDAMTREEAIQAIEVGYEQGRAMIDQGIKC